jgi:hypothetical protein
VTAESWGVALVVLAAVLVGAAVPVLVQLRATLRAIEQTLRRSGPRLDEAMAATIAAASKIGALVVRVEAAGRIEQVVDGVAAVSRLAAQLKDTVRIASAVGAAVGPALAAAVQALRDDRAPADPAPLQAVEAEPAPPSNEPARRETAP